MHTHSRKTLIILEVSNAVVNTQFFALTMQTLAKNYEINENNV